MLTRDSGFRVEGCQLLLLVGREREGGRERERERAGLALRGLGLRAFDSEALGTS